jgi:adenylate cyclase
LRAHGRRHVAAEAEWQERGAEQPFHLRVGINTGFVTVGNFGSEDRMDYTIIGRPVNLTARLQSYAELDGILLGHETYSLLKGEVAGRTFVAALEGILARLKK